MMDVICPICHGEMENHTIYFMDSNKRVNVVKCSVCGFKIKINEEYLDEININSKEKNIVYK